MRGWLSSTWGASWRPLQYFNAYRLIVAFIFLLAILFPSELIGRLNFISDVVIRPVVAIYFVTIVWGLLASIHWRKHFNYQLSGQMLLDVLVITMMMMVAGGVGSGLAILLLISLAGASLVGRGRLVLLYAAIATLAVLLSQGFGILAYGFESSSIVQAGLVSAGFFATAILARLLGQRVMVNEELARKRGEALENQMLISQRIVERMQDGVLVVNEFGRISQSNPVAREMFGFQGGEAVLLDETAPELGRLLHEWLAGWGNELVHLSGEGGMLLGARFESTSSSGREVLIFLEDLQRIKERAQQLKLASLGRLTASIAHEIRNPLSAISYAGELLREERRTEMQDRLLRILNDNVARLDRIVKDVLELGRQDRAQPEVLQLQEYSLACIEQLLAAEGLPLETIVLEGPEGVALCFDRSHWHQVMWNLLSNALRYCSRQPGAIRLKWLTKGGGRVELHVSDDGPGIQDKVREQIFEPFFTTHNQGTGLGLYIARELCSANGASLELLNTVGEGAHFVITGRNDCLEAEVIAVPVAN